MNIKIIEVSWHRNGVSGRGFHAVRFTSTIGSVNKQEAETWNLTEGEQMDNANFLAILTDDPGECYVICTDLLPSRGVRFGANSWRGDNYEAALRQGIKDNKSTGSVRIGPFALPTS